VNMNFSNCAMYDNSPLIGGNDALYMSNNAQLSASAVYVSGNANQTTGITTTDGPTGPNSIYTGVNPTPDPYANVAVPTPSTCNDTQQLNNPQDDSPPNNSRSASSTGGTWVFCKDVRMTANNDTKSFTLNPGVYIFGCGANLIMTSGVLQATGGVTLVFERNCPNGSASANPGYISVSGNASINITAPTSGPTAGIAIFQDRYTCPTSNGSSACSNTLGGGGTLNITGAAYFPNNPVQYNGGTAGGGASQCTQLIASTITFSGNATFNNNCDGTGVKTISYTQGWLVE
jgi:hypothetical protein